MAWATLPAMRVTINYIDESGSPGKTIAHLAPGTTLANAETAIAGLVADLLAASDAQIVSYGLAWGVTNTAPAAPAANSRVENRGKLHFRTAAGKLAVVSIPAIKAAAVKPSGGLDSNETSLAALVATLTGGAWTDSNGSSLDGLVADEQVFQKTSKRQYTTDRSAAN